LVPVSKAAIAPLIVLKIMKFAIIIQVLLLAGHIAKGSHFVLYVRALTRVTYQNAHQSVPLMTNVGLARLALTV
jgi:hypothetical protein